jgi:hypothetical protein
MSLLRKLDDDLKTSLKASDTLRVSVVRMAKSAIKYREIDKGSELSDDDIIAVLSTLAKQRRESIEMFAKGEREDLAEKERQELGILQSYLPQQLAPEELDGIILEAIRESSAQGTQDMGRVMRLVMPKVKGVADGKTVNQRVKELLEKP